MATVLYSATMSLDGFIAGPGGDMSWLAEVPEGPPDPEFDAEVDALVGDVGLRKRLRGGIRRAVDRDAGRTHA